MWYARIQTAASRGKQRCWIRWRSREVGQICPLSGSTTPINLTAQHAEQAASYGHIRAWLQLPMAGAVPLLLRMRTMYAQVPPGTTGGSQPWILQIVFPA